MPTPSCNLGKLYVEQKKFNEAEVIFRNYYKPGASDLRAAEGLTLLYLALNQPQKAFEVWNQEVKTVPEAVAPRLALASAALEAGQSETAIEQ